jgi:hypothetical protein
LPAVSGAHLDRGLRLLRELQSPGVGRPARSRVDLDGGRGARVVGRRRLQRHRRREPVVVAVGRARRRRDGQLGRLAVELLDLHIAELDVIALTVVLQADVAGGRHASRIGAGEVVDQRAVEQDADALAHHHDLVRVPLSRWLEHGLARRDVGRLELVDCSRGLLRSVRCVDLDFVALCDRLLRAVPGIGEADEHAGVVVALHLPVQLERVVLELLLVPQQTEAAAGQDRAVGGALEAAGAGHAPAVERCVRPVEQWRVTRGRSGGLARLDLGADRQIVEVDVAVVTGGI